MDVMIPLEVATPIALALVAAIGVLWKEQTKWQRMWAEEVKESSKDAELFAKALARKREKSSDPPPSS